MAVEAQTKNKSSSLKEFESLLNEDFKDRKLKENQIIKSVVTEITKNFVVVDCKAKMEGMIPIEEFKNDNELEKLKIGSTIEVYLERIESFKGEIVISREKARRMNAWKKMEKVFETKEELVGFITGRVKGGFICSVDGLPTFMPASQIDIRPLKKFDHLMNIPIKVIATRIDRNRGNVCTSRRAVLEKSKDAEVKEVLKNLKEGDIIEDAKVKATTDWGIFLDINGIDALLHVSDLSHGRVKKPADMVNIGQKIKVKITKIDTETNRVSASVKALTKDPYDNLEKKYKVGEIYDGTCTKLMDYGVFVKLSYKETLENPWKKIKGVNSVVEVKIKNITDKAIFAELDSGLVGMLHYKEISFVENEDDLKKFNKNDLIKVKIVEVKDEKIRFSMRALEKDPMDWFSENNKKVGDIITTTVCEAMKSGIKVYVGNDKKLIVIIKKSQLAKEAANQRPEVFNAGNRLDAKITELDTKSRTINLSVKAAQIDEEKSLVAKFGEGAAKSGATLKGIFEKALSSKRNKKDKK